MALAFHGFGDRAAGLNRKALLTWDDKSCLGSYQSGFEQHFLHARSGWSRGLEVSGGGTGVCRIQGFRSITNPSRAKGHLALPRNGVVFNAAGQAWRSHQLPRRIGAARSDAGGFRDCRTRPTLDLQSTPLTGTMLSRQLGYTQLAEPVRFTSPPHGRPRSRRPTAIESWHDAHRR